jgi:predicted DNA-binding transcriptional regulator AlpA
MRSDQSIHFGVVGMSNLLLDIKELAKRLRIPAKTIRNKLSEGTWPMEPFRIGRALRWRESDVDRAIADLATSTSNAPKRRERSAKSGARAANELHRGQRGPR